MMAQKHLHELLKEDQEPFLLKNYIADRCSQLKRPSQKTHLQVKKHKSIISSSQSSNFPRNFCKNACFFSFNNNSPDIKKSPLFDFQSPAKSPCKNPNNTVFLHIPARTAALLLEAALRIQKQSTKSNTEQKNNGFGLFGSLLKRLTHINKIKKKEISGVSDNRKLCNEKNQQHQLERVFVNEKSGCSCNYGRSSSSAIWSESNEEKSLDLDLETSSSSGQLSEEDLLVAREFASFHDDDQHFSDSPFHFVLRRSPSFGHRTPDFLSPAASPCHHRVQGKDNNYEVDQSLKKFQVQEEEEEEEEDKEQCSPVSVLDPPFEDDDDAHDGPCEDDGFDLECSYAIVQKAKHQLLAKLHRFEKLAELDPVELEKRMLDQEEEDDENDDINDLDGEVQCEEELVSFSSYKENNVNSFNKEVLSKSSFCGLRKIPKDMKRLVSDLIHEEQREQIAEGEAIVLKRVCKRLESWKEVESNTIDMMVEQDFKRELNVWKINEKQVGETAVEIELAIFGLLVEELSEELTGLTEGI